MNYPLCLSVKHFVDFPLHFVMSVNLDSLILRFRFVLRDLYFLLSSKLFHKCLFIAYVFGRIQNTAFIWTMAISQDYHDETDNDLDNARTY